MSSSTTRLESLLRVVEPVREELHSVEKELADLDAAKELFIAQQKEARDEFMAEQAEARSVLHDKAKAARGIIRLVDADDPDATAPPKSTSSTNGRGPRSYADRISTENVERMKVWLDKHEDGGEFSIVSIHTHDQFDLGLGRDSVRFALETLRDQGAVRLVRVGYIGDGPHRGRKYNVYVLTNDQGS